MSESDGRLSCASDTAGAEAAGHYASSTSSWTWICSQWHIPTAITYDTAVQLSDCLG